MHDGAACESEWQIFFAFCAFSTTDGLSLSLSLRVLCAKSQSCCPDDSWQRDVRGQVCCIIVAALANRTTADDIPPQFFMLFCGSCSHACVQRCNYHILIT